MIWMCFVLGEKKEDRTWNLQSMMSSYDLIIIRRSGGLVLRVVYKKQELF
jgi:hypothetical protein